jgi:acetyl esterase/lipase
LWPGEDAALTPGAPLPLDRLAVPVFLSVGDADPVWPHQQTLNVADALRAQGKTVDLLVAAGQGHGYDFDREPELWARLLAFFGAHL